MTHRQVLIVFSGLMLGMLLGALDQTIVATALPTITGELGGLDHLSWVITSYLLASTVSTPIYGKLGDLFGRKRLFQIAILIFLLGSVLAGVAQGMSQLIAFRAIQGLGAGGLMVLAQAIMAEIVSPRERGRYAGYFGAVFGASSIAGPLLGGFFTDHASWRWVFYINIPLGILALFVTSAVLPASTVRTRVKIDVAGSTVLTVAITCVVLFTTWGGVDYSWGSATIVGLIVASAVLFVVFVLVERRASEPVLPMHLFGNRTFSTASGSSFLMGIGMFGAISFIPLFLQVVNGASATNSGLLLLPLMAGVLSASMICGQVITRTGRYKRYPLAGCLLAAIAMFLLSTMDETTTQVTASVYMVLLGVGMGLTMQVLVLATQNAVEIKDLGVGTASVSFFRSMGGSIGVAICGAIFNSGIRRELQGTGISLGDNVTPDVIGGLPEPDHTTAVVAFADALSAVFLVSVPLMALAFVIVVALPEMPLRSWAHADDAGRDLSVTTATGTAEPDVFELDDASRPTSIPHL